jgi:hypothetical protein
MSALVVSLAPERPPTILLSAGPPCCGVFLRYWPGVEVSPDVAADGPRGPRVARLVRQLGDAVLADPERLVEVRPALDRVEAEALSEGEAADRMATTMDRDGDDRGAEVRRAVAHGYSLELVLAALEGMVGGRSAAEADI